MNSEKYEKIALVTDSCADIPKSLVEKYHIFVIPLSVFCDNTQYLDGIDISYENIFEKIKTAKSFGTSLPDGEVIENVFSKIEELGYTKAIVITISSKLSGTYNMLKLHRDIFNNLEIRVIDSKNCSLGQGMIVLQLAKYLSMGFSWRELLIKAVRLTKNTFSFIYADTLEYLQKGGRIGKITAFAGTMLNIKPILTLDKSGTLYPIAKTRGKKQGREKLKELIVGKAVNGKSFNIAAIHGNNRHEFIMLANDIKEALPEYINYWSGHAGAAVSVHLGPGVLAAAIQLLD